MSALDLVGTLRKLGVRLSVDGTELLVDAPQGVITPEIAAQIRERKVQLVALLKWSARSTRSAGLPLVPADRSAGLPLSYAQQRLWFLDQLEPGSAAYNISWTVRLKGELDIPALQQAVAAVVQRHEVLRCSFPTVDGEASVSVHDSVSVPLEHSELQGASDERLRTHLSRLAASPFDLATAPLCRVFLIKRSAHEHVLLVLIHHIVSDGASMRILFRELAELYDAAAAGNLAAGVAGLVPLDVQYADFAAWQREWLSGDQLEQQLSYWTEKLAAAPPLLSLPTDRPRSAALRFRGASVIRVLPQGLADDLRALGRSNGATLFMVMFAVFDVLLQRYSGQSDLVVGTPISGRSRTALEGLIGFFVNTAVLRTRLNDDMNFRDLLRQVRDTALEAHTHQELPFEKLVEVLQPERELSHTPVFQVMFDLQEEQRWKLPVQNLEVIPEIIFSSRTSTFDLTLSVREAESGLDAMFEYDTDLFDESTIERFAAHYQNLLVSVLQNPDVPLSQLSMLSADEQGAIVGSVPQVVAEQQTLHGLFEQSANRTPDALAVTDSRGHSATYAELESRARQIAVALLKAGVTPVSRVGVCASRSIDTVAAILGVLKTGASWMPLDPEFPQERLAAMLAVGDVRCVLAASDAAMRVPENIRRLELESILTTAVDDSIPLPKVSADAAACVLFTSGSSGQPKAVVLEHRGLSHYVQQLVRETSVHGNSRVLQFASLSFDISIEEVFVALAAGATLVLRAPGPAPSIVEFATFCDAQKVSWLSLPTAYWHEWAAQLECLDTPHWQTLKTVVIGGEKALLENWRRWQQAVGSRVQLLNTYGPTEASVAATWFDLTHQNPSAWHDIPIGRPVPGVCIAILDAQLQPQAVGVPGDLYIGGIGVARGYLGAASAAFSTLPSLAAEPARWYRTGDKARLQADGNLQYLGRADEQIKLRGHRLEPAETAAVLLQHPDIDNCAVYARKMSGDAASENLALVAWYASGVGVEVPALKQFLQSRLPDYMVPDFYVALPSLPLTANGKVDRKELPDPDFLSVAKTYRAPVSKAELQMAAIWTEVLAAPQVGLDDDFFALGGHSLLATRVVARIRDAFNRDVPLRLLFNNPTIAALLAAMEDQQQRPLSQLIRRRKTTDLPPLSFAQQRLWLLDQLQPGNSAFNLPWLLRLHGPLNCKALQLALNALLQRHESLRTRFAASLGEPVQVILPTQELPIVIHTRHGADDAELEVELRAAIAQPFDLHQGPLARADLWQIADDDHVLLLCLHHIVADGWSMGVIYRELSVLYAGFCGDTAAAALPDLPVQYADYALWQRDWLASAEFTRQLEYWRTQLSDAPPLLSLAGDYPRPATQSYSGDWLDIGLPKTLSIQLSALAAEQGCSLFMLLLAAFKVLLARYAGSDDIVVGTPVAGRQRTELETQVGFFLNTLVLRSSLRGNPRFSDLLQAVRKTALEAFEHQDLPFEKLIEDLQPERNPAYSPLVQVMFNLHNEPHTRPGFPGLKVDGFSLASGTAKFDLNVAVHERISGLLVGIEYSSDLFSAATVQRLLQEYKTLLTAIVAGPQQRLTALPLPGGVFRLGELSADSAPVNTSLAARLAAIIEQRESAPAVDDGRRCLSYAQLGECAAYLGGVLPASIQPVGLMLGHDSLTVAAIASLALLNRCWVPLDPKLPLARLQAIALDAGVQDIVVAADQNNPAQQLQSLPGLNSIVVLPNDASLWAGNPATIPANNAGSLAYILYTSGTTGTPKGVPQTPENVAAHIDCYAASLKLKADDRLSLLASYGFDAAVMDIYASLLTGACVCPVDVRHSTALLGDLHALQVSVLHSTPTVLRMVLQEEGTIPSVRALVLGGEAATSADFTIFRQRFAAGTQFVNGLGPSESTTALQFFADTNSQLPPGVVPVGRPVSGTQVELRDADGQPSAFCGELYIRSHRLAPGYWQSPKASAQAFLDAGTYRSGDQLRYLPDGNLVFSGRADGQIKLRGQRIETGEIEQHINALAGVQRSVVRLIKTGGEACLVAWYQPLASAADPQQLRTALREFLPESMLPAAFVAVPSLPLTPNGKLDVAALPAPEFQLRQAYRAPATTLACQLAAIWEEVLGVAAVGLDDDFFALGGHSLMATRMMARVRDRLRARVPLAELFTHPVLERFASAVANYSEDRSVPLVARHSDERQLAPLSWSQQRLWFLDQLEPESTAYTLHRATRLKGALDSERLQAALDALVSRHESLRTVFASQSGDPVQMVVPALSVYLQTAALSGATDEVLQNRLLDEVRRPFDLQRGPLLRALLLHVAADDAVLLISMHHIISDGWSMGVLCDELNQCYRRGANTALPELPVQYIDYALWQRDWLTGAELENQLSYWREQLQDVPPVLDMPFDRPRPVVASYRGAWHQKRLSVELSRALHELARSSNATLYMVLLAAFNVVLARYSGRDDIVVGSPVAGRQRSELEALIGFFLNTLVMRNDLSGDPELGHLVARVRETALGAYQHQDLPFEKLLEELQPARSLSTAPLVQVMFNLHNEFDRPLALTDESYSFHIDRGAAKFDVNLAVADSREGLLLAMEYSTDLFDAASIEAMLALFEWVLTQMVADSTQRLSELPWRPAAAEVAVPIAKPFSDGQTIVSVFDAQLPDFADRPAVQSGAEQWTYRELAARSNAVARDILAVTAPTDVPQNETQRVGLLLGHDAVMLAGLFGTLKAGKTYVPLDPDSPPERLRTIVAGAGISAIVAAAQFAELAEQLCGDLPLVLVADSLATDPGAPALQPAADDLAYILFTSGTTGMPKGVMQTHANVLHHAKTYRNALGIGEVDRLSLLSPFGFDAAVMDIFASLLSGACLCPFDLKHETYLGAVIEDIANSGITLLHATPTVYRYLMRHKICRHDVSEVRAVVLGGEAAKNGDFEFFKNNFKPHTIFVNGLGPSECTLALQWFADQSTTLQGGLVPAGVPVAGVDVLLLDEQQCQSAICGELAIACEHVTPGYWQQPELTAKAFVEIAGRRWYRTGDRARYLPDGNLLFSGRVDEQIKLRGHRVEPGEIEAQLIAHERVDRAVVALRNDTQGNSRLVAWVVANKRESVEAGELREHLQRRLPRYMVPSAIVIADNLPLTTNGKVDRRALPLPKWGRNEEQAYVAPRNELEARLAAIWAEVLGVDKVGVEDDFFELGGHSLLAMQLMARTTESLQVGLPLRRLFDGPTIAEVARAIDDVRWTLGDDKGADTGAEGSE